MNIDSTKCNGCSKIFKFYNRKMICENCDLVFCSKCRNLEIEMENNPKKVCSTCFHFLVDKSNLISNTTSNNELEILKREILSNANSIINTGINTTEILVQQQQQTRNDLKKIENINENLTHSDRLITKLSSGFGGLFRSNKQPTKNNKPEIKTKPEMKTKPEIKNKPEIKTKLEPKNIINIDNDGKDHMNIFYDELLDNITQIQDISKNQQTISEQHTEYLKELNIKVVDANSRIDNNTKKIKKIT